MRIFLTLREDLNYAANPSRIEWQRQIRADTKKRMAFCIALITRKIDGCLNNYRLTPVGS